MSTWRKPAQEMTVTLVVTLQREHDVISDPLIVLPVITVNQPNGAVAKQELKKRHQWPVKRTAWSCKVWWEFSRESQQAVLFTSLPAFTIAWHRAAMKKQQTSVWNFSAKHRLLLSAATPLFAVGCLASGASSDHQIHSTESKGDEKCQ